jgi:ATP-dependent exoDNAse (exonuclease V) alpha subunit
LLRNGNILPNEIMVCALAGTAANRAKNVIGLPYSKTIHAMLGIVEDPKTGKPLLKYNEKNKLPYKLVVVDESAMIDNFLFISLLKAIDFDKTKIIFIGDIAQLPPVGKGAPFEEFVNSKVTYDIKVNFSKIFRQKEGVLIQTANNIRMGIIDGFFNDKEFNSKDFYYKQYKSENKAEIKQDIEEIIENDIKKYIHNLKNKKYGETISAFQVLSPQKKGFMGVYHLNRIIQRTVHKFLNPDKDIYFLLSYYIIDFLNASENKKYSSFLKIKKIIEKIKENGYSSQTEAKIYEKIIKEIQKVEKKKIFYHFEKFIRKNSHYLFNFYGFYYGEKYIYREYDKVIHLKNGDYITFDIDTYFFLKDAFISGEINKYNFKKHKMIKDQFKKQRVYNGQIGIVDSIINSLGVFVIYPFEGYVVLYNSINEDILNPAYSISVHKSQGQEYQKIYIPIIDKHMFMLNNKALYTAVTRGKEKVYIFAQKYTVPKIINKKEIVKRQTYLSYILH